MAAFGLPVKIQVWQWQLHEQPEHHHHDSSAEKTGNKQHQRKGLGWNHTNAEPWSGQAEMEKTLSLLPLHGGDATMMMAAGSAADAGVGLLGVGMPRGGGTGGIVA